MSSSDEIIENKIYTKDGLVATLRRCPGNKDWRVYPLTADKPIAVIHYTGTPNLWGLNDWRIETISGDYLELGDDPVTLAFDLVTHLIFKGGGKVVEIEVLRDAWPRILDLVQLKSRIARLSLEGSVPVLANGATLTVFSPRGNVDASGRYPVLREAIRETTGLDLLILPAMKQQSDA